MNRKTYIDFYTITMTIPPTVSKYKNERMSVPVGRVTRGKEKSFTTENTTEEESEYQTYLVTTLLVTVGY